MPRYIRDIHCKRHTHPNEKSRQAPEQVHLRQHPPEQWTGFVPRIQRLAISSAAARVDADNILDYGVHGWPYGCTFSDGGDSEGGFGAKEGEEGGEEEDEAKVDDEGRGG